MLELHFPDPIRGHTQRHSVAGKATFFHLGIEAPVDVGNISVEGMQIATPLPVTAGSRLTIRLPDQSKVNAQVRWAHDGRAGLRFDRDLPSWQVDQIIEATTPVAALEVGFW
jgi:hypothetical protein